MSRARPGSDKQEMVLVRITAEQRAWYSEEVEISQDEWESVNKACDANDENTLREFAERYLNLDDANFDDHEDVDVRLIKTKKDLQP